MNRVPTHWASQPAESTCDIFLVIVVWAVSQAVLTQYETNYGVGVYSVRQLYTRSYRVDPECS